MERTEIVSLYKNTPADGTVVTVCGWAKNIRDSKNIGLTRSRRTMSSCSSSMRRWIRKIGTCAKN